MSQINWALNTILSDVYFKNLFTKKQNTFMKFKLEVLASMKNVNMKKMQRDAKIHSWNFQKTF